MFDQIADLLDENLSARWVRRYDEAAGTASFRLPAHGRDVATVKVDDGTIKITEYVEGTYLIASEVTISGAPGTAGRRAQALIEIIEAEVA